MTTQGRHLNKFKRNSQMLHTKIPGDWPSGSGEEDLFMFLTYMAIVAILVM